MIRTTTILFVLFSFSVLQAQPPRSYTSSEILLQLKKLNTVGSVLYIAAHPDDENTRLIAYLANEKCLRTGYLSLTRGDGGQNLIGPEQGVELGVIRTQELLAARRIDGGEQFFTRAYDFGYSKTPEETFKKWNKDSVLSDVVWVIRNFRPDIIITRFATDGSGGHGHHTASAILAEEAFDAAGDPKRFPEQLQYVDVWQPRRLFYNATNRFRDPNADMSTFIKLDVGGYNPLLGKSYGEIAAESRSMHKSQGFGSAKQRGEYFEYFKPVKGDTAGLKDIFEGMDFSWERIKGGAKIGKELQQILNTFNPADLSSTVTQLEKISIPVTHSSGTPAYDEVIKHQLNFRLDEVYRACIGYFSEVTTKTKYIANGDSVEINFSLISRNRKIDSIGFLFNAIPDLKNASLLKKNVPHSASFKILAKNMWWGDNISPTDVYYMKIKNNLYESPGRNFIYNYFGRYENESWIKSEGMLNQYQSFSGNTASLRIGQKDLADELPLKYKKVDPELGEIYDNNVVILPDVTLNAVSPLIIFTDTAQRKIGFRIKCNTDLTWVDLAPYNTNLNWSIQPESSGRFMMKKGEEKLISFRVTPSLGNSCAIVHPEATTYSDSLSVNSARTFSWGTKELNYDHIPKITLFPEAEVKLIHLDIKRKLKRIGYIPGAGDEVAPCLQQLGYEVVTLTDEKLAKENLNQFEAIVTGVRAYNTNEKLLSFKQKLMDYVAAGGNLIVQYNTNSWAGPLSSDIGPYKFKITRERITDEEAKVNFELPNHPVLNTPNKITDKDFEGWIQERSIYHAGDWDSNYVAPLSMADPGEKNNKGALIIAKHGKGHFVYSGLVFFRQLPAGVPGAYRLLVNMIELGK